jgi:hypothetical protein
MKTMKKITYLILLATMAFSGCTKMLDIEPTDAIADYTALKDRAGIEHAVTGTYNTLHAAGLYYRNQIIVGDLSADNLVFTGTTLDYEQISSKLIPADNAIIDGMWSANYDGINRANNVLNSLPAVSDMTQGERDDFEGQMLFLRAFFHFNLSNFFGGVPIKTKPTLDLSNIDQAKNSIEEVYAQVIEDLVSAEQKLPATSVTGKANSFAATALLARVYLAQFHLTNDAAKATLAIEKATKVIAESGYVLAPAYGDLFGGTENEGIFTVVFDAQNRNRLAQYFFPRSMTGRYEVAPSPEFIAGYEADDTLRKVASIAYDDGNLPYVTKYTDITTGTDPVFMIRLAEMYLIRAEALAFTSGDKQSIRDDVNVIRTRAGLVSIDSDDYTALQLAVEHERQYEFAFEGLRRFDLVRTKRATTVLGIEQDYTIFPIPLSEFNTNKLMKQNQGY